MNNQFVIRIVSSICILLIFLISGCATQSVWKKRSHNDTTVIHERNALADGFFSKCANINVSKNEIIIPFFANRDSGEFPPVDKGFLVISSDEKTDYIVKIINEIQSSQNGDNKLILLKADYWQTADPDKNIKYWSGYQFSLRDKYRKRTKFGTSGPNPGFINSKDIDIRIIPESKSSQFDMSCVSLTKFPVNFEITFTQGSIKYSQYKNSLGYRVVATPFAIIIDGVTSPFQLIAFLTVPLWAPK